MLKSIKQKQNIFKQFCTIQPQNSFNKYLLTINKGVRDERETFNSKIKQYMQRYKFNSAQNLATLFTNEFPQVKTNLMADVLLNQFEFSFLSQNIPKNVNVDKSDYKEFMKIHNVQNPPVIPSNYKLQVEEIQNIDQISKVLTNRIMEEEENGNKLNSYLKIALLIKNYQNIPNIENLNEEIEKLEDVINDDNLDALFIKTVLQFIQKKGGHSLFTDTQSLNDNINKLINNGQNRALIQKTLILSEEKVDEVYQHEAQLFNSGQLENNNFKSLIMHKFSDQLKNQYSKQKNQFTIDFLPINQKNAVLSENLEIKYLDVIKELNFIFNSKNISKNANILLEQLKISKNEVYNQLKQNDFFKFCIFNNLLDIEYDQENSQNIKDQQILLTIINSLNNMIKTLNSNNLEKSIQDLKDFKSLLQSNKNFQEQLKNFKDIDNLIQHLINNFELIKKTTKKNNSNVNQINNRTHNLIKNINIAFDDLKPLIIQNIKNYNIEIKGHQFINLLQELKQNKKFEEIIEDNKLSVEKHLEGEQKQYDEQNYSDFVKNRCQQFEWKQNDEKINSDTKNETFNEFLQDQMHKCAEIELKYYPEQEKHAGKKLINNLEENILNSIRKKQSGRSLNKTSKINNQIKIDNLDTDINKRLMQIQKQSSNTVSSPIQISTESNPIKLRSMQFQSKQGFLSEENFQLEKYQIKPFNHTSFLNNIKTNFRKIDSKTEERLAREIKLKTEKSDQKSILNKISPYQFFSPSSESSWSPREMPTLRLNDNELKTVQEMDAELNQFLSSRKDLIRRHQFKQWLKISGFKMYARKQREQVRKQGKRQFFIKDELSRDRAPELLEDLKTARNYNNRQTRIKQGITFSNFE